MNSRKVCCRRESRGGKNPSRCRHRMCSRCRGCTRNGTSFKCQGPAGRQNEDNVQASTPVSAGPDEPRSDQSARRARRAAFKAPFVRTDDALTDEDLQLALYCCYELHYQGFDQSAMTGSGIPLFSKVRASSRRRSKEDSEQRFRMKRHRGRRGARCAVATEWGRLVSRFRDGYLEHGNRFHVEGDRNATVRLPAQGGRPPHWAIPRRSGRAKAAIVSIQSDEYGNGYTEAMHSSLFADAMRALDLDPTYWRVSRSPAGRDVGHDEPHLNVRPAPPSRGALVGHLASFEMNSVGPMARYSAWL